MLRLYLLLFIVGTLGGIGYTGYAYYTTTQETIAQLRENNLLLTQAAETNQETIDRLVNEAAVNAQRQAALQERLSEAEGSLNRLRRRFAQINIYNEALEDPADLEARVNRAVERLIREIAEETGGSIEGDMNDVEATADPAVDTTAE